MGRNVSGDRPSGAGAAGGALRTALDITGGAPTCAVVLGSGLREVAAVLGVVARCSFSEVAGLIDPSTAGHSGEFVLSDVDGTSVLLACGRFHLYEGAGSLGRIQTLMRAVAEVGTRTVVLTNAAGGIAESAQPGAVMIVRDHLNFMFGESQSLARHLPGSEGSLLPPYDPIVSERLLRAAISARAAAFEGVYAGVIGPSYETPAEIRMLRRLGASAVGMSTVPDALAARRLGMACGALSCITNRAAGAGSSTLSHNAVLTQGSAMVEVVARVLSGWVRATAEARE